MKKIVPMMTTFSMKWLVSWNGDEEPSDKGGKSNGGNAAR